MKCMGNGASTLSGMVKEDLPGMVTIVQRLEGGEG